SSYRDHSHADVSQYRQDHALIMRSIVHMTDATRSGIMPPNQLTTINQSQLSAQLGLSLGGANLPHTSPSPPASKSATPSPSSSINEEDTAGEKRAAPDSGKKPKTPKKKKKKDPNEPQKPVSAYALFFRDTQAAIKGQNPNATFGEVSKIVASMWDSLGEEQKQVYKRKTEAAKKEYLKALAAYRASLVSKVGRIRTWKLDKQDYCTPKFSAWGAEIVIPSLSLWFNVCDTLFHTQNDFKYCRKYLSVYVYNSSMKYK
uniref:TOX high mobility group box family member 3 n=1 Tax=Anolis carolinensis TaxID=28377 RepID=H9GIS5_ANOCA